MTDIFYRMTHRARRWLVWLWNLEGTPGQRARGLAAGVFSGCFPLFGLQTLLGFILATLIKGNHLLAVAGTWISNPVTYLPLYWFNYTVGCTFLGDEKGLNDLSHLTWVKLWSQGSMFLERLLVGSTIVGLISSLFVGTITYLSIKNLPRT